MQTIREFIDSYNSVLNGIPISIQGYTISSDGKNWLVDGKPIDTLENRKSTLAFVMEKYQEAASLLTYLGEDISQMERDYYLRYDPLDGMILLSHNGITQLNFIYMCGNSTVIELIDKMQGMMVCHRFAMTKEDLGHASLSGNLSLKSKRLLLEKLPNRNASISQNFFYDMLFEGMNTYQDLINALESSRKK